MSKKQEIAALMTGDGDNEQKIALLKKAIVAVTRQKQEAERRCEALESTLRETETALATARAESDALRRQLGTVQGSESQAESRKTASLGHHTLLQGLSSLVTGSETTHTGARTTGPRPTRRGSPRSVPRLNATISLSAEDVERLVAENEMLHKQIFELTSERADLKQVYEVDVECWRKEQTEAQQEMHELQIRLESATQAYDALHVRAMRNEAFAAFCRHLVLPKIRAQIDLLLSCEGGATPLTHVKCSSDKKRDELLGNMCDELIHGPLREFFATLRSLLMSMSALLTACLQIHPRTDKATTGDLCASDDRLVALHGAHERYKARLVDSMRELDDILCATPHAHSTPQGVPAAPFLLLDDTHGYVEASPTAHVRLVQSAMVQDALEWVALLREHALLLVDAVMSCAQETVTFQATITASDAARAEPKGEATDRTTLAHTVVREIHTTLCALEGVLEAVQNLFEGSSDTAVPSPASLASEPTTSATSPTGTTLSAIEWLLALQRFLWEGCQALPVLQHAMRRLSHCVSCLAVACTAEHLKQALGQVASALLELAPPYSGPMMNGFSTNNVGTVPAPMTGADLHMSGPVIATDTGDELVSVLAHCDRAAMDCYNRMADTLLALATREDALRISEDTLQRTRDALTAVTSDAAQTRLALEDQIRVLSQQLTTLV